MTRIHAIIATTQTRLRPIMMSTLTTVFGLAPDVFLAGDGIKLYSGLGSSVLFGLLFSTLLTLTFMLTGLNLTFKFTKPSGHDEFNIAL